MYVYLCTYDYFLTKTYLLQDLNPQPLPPTALEMVREQYQDTDRRCATLCKYHHYHHVIMIIIIMAAERRPLLDVVSPKVR